MSDLFEIIDSIPQNSPSVVEKVVEPQPTPSHLDTDTEGEQLTWCEFCKDWYIEEYHFGEQDD